MNYEPIMFRCSVEGSFRTTRAGQAPPAPVALSGGRVARSRAGGAKAPRGAHAARVLKGEQNCVEADSGLPTRQGFVLSRASRLQRPAPQCAMSSAPPTRERV